MKWTVRIPRLVAEDHQPSVTVDADTIEEAVTEAAKQMRGCAPGVGEVYIVSARVEVCKRPTLPLKSI